ncbi:DUF636-domain-containing protein [Hesseltinella vesiculosa]|uniref:DUF636-domain-containing protein n=1 Tax=Hesseltinella vesiculosa TaxID=101127 RepID=A0A1X2G7N8_9FUNG|nr:DUF636-domain-containing protein [Hesseltinella vesiculosa]
MPSRESLTGGCLCGQYRYTITMDDAGMKQASHCHCRFCRKATGCAFLTCLAVPLPDLHVASGTLQVYHSSPTAQRSFCPTCGSQVVFTYVAQPAVVYITIGSLDEPHSIQPSRHIFADNGILPFDLSLPTHRQNSDSPLL